MITGPVIGWKYSSVSYIFLQQIHNNRKYFLIQRIKDYFIAYDYNVIAVDWHKPAASINYFYSAFNTRIIGAMIANFIRRLVQVFSYKLSDIELMGHSLGGHIMGFAGKHFNDTNNKIGFISGLDPAGPGFDTHSLEHTDADLVIAVHTSAGLLKAGNYEKFI
jgi:pancreatic triacylglycerol lipase